MRYRLGCSLAYVVKAPTTFILDVEVVRLTSLEVARQTLTLLPEPKRCLCLARPQEPLSRRESRARSV